MKLPTILLTALALAGCANSVTRATPGELIAAPGGKAELATALDYDAAYRRLDEQMKTCFQRKLGLTGTSQLVVISDKGAKDARVSISQSSLLGARALYTVTLTPVPAGVKVALYTANPEAPPPMVKLLDGWLNRGETACANDATPESKP